MTDEMNDPKILFINPCLRPGGHTKLLPVGLGSVMTYFHERGYNFTLLDIDINEYDDEYVENYLKNNKFDFILFGTLVTHYKWIKWLVNTAKKYQPNSHVIVGNSVASSIPELFLQKTKADVVIIGEGEISAYETVRAIQYKKPLHDITGIAFRTPTGEIKVNDLRKAGNIEDFSMINWDFFDVERYLAKPSIKADREKDVTRAMPVITARGCAFKCTFCHYVFWNDPYRNRKPKSVISEIKNLIDKYHVTHIDFWDDLSFASAYQVEKMCDEFLANNLKFKWMCSVRVDLFSRANLSSEDALRVAEKMKKSGCYDVGFALESGNQEILEMMNKKIDVNAFIETVKIFKQVGITVNTSVVFGYPTESKQSIHETFDQCLRAGVYPSIGFLLPLPSTGMYDYAKQKGFITDEDRYLESITERQDICLNMTKMSNDEIMNEIKTGAKELNDMFDLGLNENTYIKTKGYKNSKINEKKLLAKTVTRNENDVSFNYSNQEFEFES
tara:strand:+ start:1685 stop:3187 length:1503 start_codon:yes stop_codon:yes gene_type:complete